ncbi:MAG: acetylornithine/succinylornithine family transaminase [Candidatus Lambdaproteobacteria bacterium]|nr:acetylornithine/succinylornithine family transaminase [Candidatus Lambdaproteobacteria bacterium]
MTASPTAELLRDAEQSLMFIVKRPEAVMVRGKGPYLWDTEGKRYLDFIAGWAVTCLGHCPPVLARALAGQAKALINASPALLNEPMIRLAKLLTDHSCLDKVFFANSGAEANEGAVKLARKWGALRKDGAYEVITAWNSFHGRTLAMMSATGKQHWNTLYEPKVPGFTRVPFNDLGAMKKAITPKTCAIMLEPVQGEGGVWVADRAYLRGVRKLCDEHNVLLILDEIQTGVGRLGTLWGYEQYGIEPDIMTLGKGIGGGFPLAALLAKDAVSVFEAGDQGGTFCGQPLAMASGLAVMNEVIGKNIATKAKNRGNYLRRKLKALEGELGLSNVRGKGLLMAVDLPKSNGPDLVTACFKRGLLINAPLPNSVRFMPPLNITAAHVDEMVELFADAVRNTP